MSIPSPYKDPTSHGYVTIGGSRMPGVLTAIGVPGRKYEFAVQQGYGQTKVTIYRMLDILDGIEIEHYLQPAATPDARDDFEILRDDFMPFLIPGWPNKLVGRPKAFPLVHPEFQWLGLKRAHLIEFECPRMKTPGDPARWYKMRFQEDVPQVRIPVGPPEPAKINGPPTPKDAGEAVLLKAAQDFLSEDSRPTGGLFSLFGGG